MDILDESSGAQLEQVQLDDLIETSPITSSVPQASIRNRAALDAILTAEPQNLVDKFRLLMREAGEGNDVSHEDAMNKIAQVSRDKDMRYIINVLGDKNVPIEQKEKLFNLVKQGNFKEDPAITLRTQALSSPSEGETIRGEAARISTAELMQDIQADAEKRQRMANTIAASLPNASARTVAEVAEAEVMPFGRNIIAANINEALKKAEGKDTNVFTWIGDFLTPGTTKLDIRERLNRIPVGERDGFYQAIKEGIKNASAILPNENSYAQFRTTQEILDSPAITRSEAWVENMLTLFDVFWIADGVKRVGKVINGAKGAPVVAEAGGEASKARRPGSAKEGVEDVPFEEVQRADWELVKDPTNPMQIGKPKDRIGYDNKGPKLLEGPKEAKEADDFKRLQLNSVVRHENPVSPYAIVEQSNPQKARELHEAVVKSQTDELSEAIAGVKREQFIANNVMPQVATESGNVLYKVSQEIVEGVRNTGATRFTAEELAQAFKSIKSGYKAVEGLKINDAMTTFRLDGDRVIVSGHYTAPGGSFNTAEEAKKHAAFHLRKFGVKEENIEIMRREGIDYVRDSGPASYYGPRRVEVDDGDYVIKVNTNHEITSDDIKQWSNLDVKRNFFDRVGFTVTDGGGSLSRWLMDASSMLHPVITESASVGVDQSITFEKILLKPIKELRSQIEGFAKERRAAIEEYLKEANLKQIAFDPVKLYAKGFNAEEIEALRKWQNIQDGHYYLENLDLVRTLRSQGYQLFENSNFRGFAKPTQKNQNIGRVYDPDSDSIVMLDSKQLDELYEQGGTYAKLRRPESINGVVVEHFIVRNNSNSYLRRLTDTDKVLNYRPGYYTIQYKAPKFVEEKYIDPTTKEEGWRAIAVAGSTEEADIYRANAQASRGTELRVRNDIRSVRHDSDSYWDLNSSRGRIAQRHRGQTLEDASGLEHLGDGDYMAHPMESAVRAAKSLSDRTMMRNIIETAKQRAIAQYGDMFPPDGYGGKRFPNSIGEISDKGDTFGKSIADARTTVEFVRYLEQGYINSTDNAVKAVVNILANWLGSKHFTVAEKAARSVSDVGVTHVLKGSVFQAYIALNPLRQILLQPHQSVRMAAYLGPKGYGAALMNAANYLGFKGGVAPITPTNRKFIEFIENSGALAGVDQHSLVRGMKIDLADSASKAKRILGQIASAPQTAGFNAGEKINQLVHLSAVYTKRTKEGYDLTDKTLRDRAYAESRALGYEMNYAGDMPYNQTALAAQFQFLQVPHKALLQLTNRKINNKDLVRLALFDLIMWGVPVTPVAAWIGHDLLSDDSTVRDVVTEGLEAVGFNKLINLITEEDDDVAFSGLNPYDFSGFLKLWDTYLDDGAIATVLASPAGQLWLKDGGRIPNAVSAMARFTMGTIKEDEDRPTFMSAVKEVAKISSGWNNAYKARIMLETRKKFDQYGNVTDDNVTTGEAFMQIFGFGPDAEVKLYEMSRAVDKLTKARQEEVRKMYSDIMRWTSQALETEKPDIEYILSVQNKLMIAFEGDPQAQEMVRRMWREDMKGKHRQLAEKFMKAAGLSDPGHLKDLIRQSPLDPAIKEQLLERVDHVQLLRNK